MGAKTKSKVTSYTDSCFFCGGECYGEHHLLFGTGIRNLAEEDGLKVPICPKCHTSGRLEDRIHDNPMAEKLSKRLGQAIYERNLIAEEGCTIEQSKERFRKRYGKSYF